MDHNEHRHAARHAHRQRLVAQAAEHVELARVAHEGTPEERRRARATLLGHAQPLPEPEAP